MPKGMPEALPQRREEVLPSPEGRLPLQGRRAEGTRITVLDYDGEKLEEREVAAVEECFPFRQAPTVTWINVEGLGEVEKVEKLGGAFGMHPLVLEDILAGDQRPKVEDLDDYLCIVLKMLDYDEEAGEVIHEQVSLILGQAFVISFQEGREGDVFDPVRERIRSGKGRLRKLGADHLAYALLDAVVDRYFPILERIGDRVDALEEELVSDPTARTLEELHRLKREMLYLRRSVWPLREVISGLERAESPLIQESTGIYLRDVYDHIIQVIDTIETYRDMLAGMLDIYLSSVSNRMNAVMKVLTIIATIFMPLTFLAGVYGMNFKHMPELEWGYPLIWGVILFVGLVMLLYFKRKQWL
jgi:magnesium transporter